MAQALGKMGPRDFRELIKILSLMERKHQIRFEEDGSLTLEVKKKHEITLKGIFHAHKNGFGFVSLEGEEDDLFVGKNDVNYAIDGDTVEVVIKKVADRNKGTAAEAKIIDILEHSLTTVVGQIVLDQEKPKYAGYIRSKNQKISQPIYVKKPALKLEEPKFSRSLSINTQARNMISLSLVSSMWWGIQRMSELMSLRFWSLWTLYPSFQKPLSRKQKVCLMLRLKRIWKVVWI